jgi:hypothetical protein
MKKLFIVLFLCLTTLPMFAQDRPTNLGLVAELAYIKSASEWNLVHYFSSQKNKISKDDSLKAISRYNQVCFLINPLILQLEADITLHISMHNYKKLDKLLKKDSQEAVSTKNKDMLPYLNTIKKASTASQKIEGENTKAITETLAIITSISSILSTNVGTFKNIQDMKVSRASSICKILETLKLSAPSELLNTLKTDASKTTAGSTPKP